MERRDSLHHRAHVAAVLADREQAQRHRSREAARFHRLGHRPALADRTRRRLQARAQPRMQQVRAERERCHHRHAAAQKHSDRAVEARELVELHAFARARQSPDRVDERRARGRQPQQVESRGRDCAQGEDHEDAPMLDELAPR